MTAAEQDHVVLCAIGDGLVTSRQIRDALPYLSLRQVAAACGRLRKRGLLRDGVMRCAVCDGRGRVRTWQRSAEYPESLDGAGGAGALASIEGERV